jgi:hypothetical protein
MASVVGWPYELPSPQETTHTFAATAVSQLSLFE